LDVLLIGRRRRLSRLVLSAHAPAVRLAKRFRELQHFWRLRSNCTEAAHYLDRRLGNGCAEAEQVRRGVIVFVSRDHQNRLLAALPETRLTVDPGGGHAVHREDPGQFTADLTAFLTTVTQRRH
jgi:pimeloyl-ACP methyl ester carboxylesterase